MKIDISRRDTALLKGIAIFGIFLHNYCHWLPNCVSENEYMFRMENTWKMVEYTKNLGPHLILNLFSYFGHYGVPLFVFLSGYGLVRKYERTDAKEVSIWRFIRYNVLKLWKLLALGVVWFWFSDAYLRDGRFVHDWHHIPLLFGFISNLLPKRDLLLGPWWFFSLIIQLYIIYRLFFYRYRNRTLLLVFTGICLLLQVGAIFFFNSPKQEVLDYLRYNFVGCMIPFAAGIWAARYEFSLSPKMMLPSLLLLLAGCFNSYLWLLTPLLAVTLTLPLAHLITGTHRRFWEWLGGISSSLFVIHPILRPYFTSWASKGDIYLATLFYIVACLLVAWLYHKLLELLPNPKA